MASQSSVWGGILSIPKCNRARAGSGSTLLLSRLDRNVKTWFQYGLMKCQLQDMCRKVAGSPSQSPAGGSESQLVLRELLWHEVPSIELFVKEFPVGYPIWGFVC